MKDTLTCLEMGAIEICIVWENLEVNRHVLLNKETGEEHIVYLTPEQEKDDSNFKDKETGVDLESTESGSMLEWLANEYKKFGCQLEFVTDRSEEGSQFVKGFGGIGGILRYQVDPTQFEVASDVESGDDDSADATRDTSDLALARGRENEGGVRTSRRRSPAASSRSRARARIRIESWYTATRSSTTTTMNTNFVRRLVYLVAHARRSAETSETPSRR